MMKPWSFFVVHLSTHLALRLQQQRNTQSDEWDDKDKLSIKFILDEMFRGWIGVTSAGPVSDDSFYGKFQCVTATYWKSQIKVLSNYWFIQSVP